MPARQLERILASATFQQVDRLKRFLSFIVTEAIAGRGDQLKEYVIGVQVFGKEDIFDPRTDPIVRVQARRLRARLVRYYREEGRPDELIIELPKGGYAPAFKRPRRRRARKRSIGAALVSRNTVAVLPFADHSASRRSRLLLPGAARGDHHRADVARDAAHPRLGSDRRRRRQRSAACRRQPARRAGRQRQRAQERQTLRITAHLIDSGQRLLPLVRVGSTSRRRDFAAQEAVAQVIVKKLERGRDRRAARRAARRPTENLAAHNLYLQGRYHLNQRTEEGLRKAVDFFEKALVEDATTRSRTAASPTRYGLLTHYGVFGPADVWTKAAASAATAVMLDRIRPRRTRRWRT